MLGTDYRSYEYVRGMFEREVAYMRFEKVRVNFQPMVSSAIIKVDEGNVCEYEIVSNANGTPLNRVQGARW